MLPLQQVCKQSPRLATFLQSKPCRSNPIPLLRCANAATTAAPVSETASRPTSGRHVRGIDVSGEDTHPAAAEKPSTAPTATSHAACAPESPFNWSRQWYPITPANYLDPKRPHPVMLLGKRLALWHDSILGWRAVEDRCPHRLAPLSEGRVGQTAEGTRLACAYHGWQFDANGKCTNVPQLADLKAITTACNSPHSCVAQYPIRDVFGLLFVWMDASPEGLAAAQVAPPPWVPEEIANDKFDAYMSEFPNDYSFWMEQGFDPSHANYLHHGEYFSKDKAVPMSADLTSAVDIDKGFTWAHRGYDEKDASMWAFREFRPPGILKAVYEMPDGTRPFIAAWYVPMYPGRSRNFIYTTLLPPKQQQLPPRQELLQLALSPFQRFWKFLKSVVSGAYFMSLVSKSLGSPHWLSVAHTLGDQDVAMMAQQQAYMREQGLTNRNYALFSRSDEGIIGVNKWLRKAGYGPGFWKARVEGKGVVEGSAAANMQHEKHQQDLLRGKGVSYANTAPWAIGGPAYEALFDRKDRHVNYCHICQKGLRLVAAVCTSLTIAAAASALLSVISFTAALSSTMITGSKLQLTAVAPSVLLASIAALFAFWQARLSEWRVDRFISGYPAWQKMGALSLVPKFV